jgi:hypothetical protein
MDIPAYLLAIDQSGMTYANAQQARQDLILFGARPLLHAIEERLSMDDILPRGVTFISQLRTTLPSSCLPKPRRQTRRPQTLRSRPHDPFQRR